MQILMPKGTKKRATPCEMAQTTKPCERMRTRRSKIRYEPLICAVSAENVAGKMFSIGSGSIPVSVIS